MKIVFFRGFFFFLFLFSFVLWDRHLDRIHGKATKYLVH